MATGSGFAVSAGVAVTAAGAGIAVGGSVGSLAQAAANRSTTTASKKGTGFILHSDDEGNVVIGSNSVNGRRSRMIAKSSPSNNCLNQDSRMLRIETVILKILKSRKS